MWGIVPAAGRGSRIQPLAFSKELLPVGSRRDGDAERPCAVGEYLLDRMVRGGATRICLVIGADKSDILAYFGGAYRDASLVYAVQPEPAGLCDAIFRAVPLIASDERVLVGLPDTIWFPADGFLALADDRLSFLLFEVDRPEVFDAVVLGASDRVERIEVKVREPATRWVWGAFKMPGHVLHDLHALWCERGREDLYFGTLVNAWLERGGEAFGVRAGTAYVDVGTLGGYRAAVSLLSDLEGGP